MRKEKNMRKEKKEKIKYILIAKGYNPETDREEIEEELKNRKFSKEEIIAFVISIPILYPFLVLMMVFYGVPCTMYEALKATKKENNEKILEALDD